MLTSFFKPASIALIGASEDASKIGGKIMRTLLRERYPGRFYPVNPGRATVAGLQAWPRIGDLPEVVDLVLIAIPAALVPDALRDCAARGIRNAVIFSSGFSEEGGEGTRLQQEIEAICRETGMRVNGPNSEGFFDVRASVAATFSPAIDLPRPKPEASASGIVSQSGGLGFALYNRGRQRNMAFSSIVSVGNQVDLEVADYVDHLLDDPGTDNVLMYVESFKRPQRFLASARRAAEVGKPLVIAKVGRSSAGQRAAASHTGALAGSVRVSDAVLAHHGVLRANDQDEMLDLASAFSLRKRMRGNRVAIVSTSGGTAVWLTDTCEEMGFEVPPIDAGRRARLAEFIPSYGSTDNPVDITAQGVNGYAQSLRILGDADYIDAIIIASSFAHDTRLKKEGEEIAALSRALDVPVFIYSYTLPSASSWEILDRLGLHCYTSITGCVRGMQGLLAWSQFQQRRSEQPAPSQPPALPPPAQALLREGAPGLCEYEAKALLAHMGLPFPAERLARSADEAVAIARDLGWPVVLKIQSPQIPHKTDAGGVVLHLDSDAAVRQAFDAICTAARGYAPQAEIHGVLVQSMVRPDLEMVAGIVQDADFGPMVMVGFGGVYVEVLDDTVLAPAPLSHADAHAMLRKLRGYPILTGARGRAPRDLDALCTVLVQLSQLAVSSHGLLAELDLNPIFLREQGAGLAIVDALGIRSSSHA